MQVSGMRTLGPTHSLTHQCGLSLTHSLTSSVPDAKGKGPTAPRFLHPSSLAAPAAMLGPMPWPHTANSSSM